MRRRKLSRTQAQQVARNRGLYGSSATTFINDAVSYGIDMDGDGIPDGMDLDGGTGLINSGYDSPSYDPPSTDYGSSSSDFGSSDSSFGGGDF